jgi:hypothetical protein
VQYIPGENEPKPTDPSVKLVKDIMALPGWPEFMSISGIVTSPVMRADGSIHDWPGYDPITKTFYSGDLRLALPEKPTREDATECAKYILNEVFGEFPFADEASRANVLAALLTVVTKRMVGGNTPLGLIDKPQAGTGASLIAEIIAEITTGNGACMEACPDDDEEWRKAITSILMRGPQMVVLDNLSDTLKAPKLSQMLTARTWSDRLLGQNRIIDLPQTAAWFVTGNNIQLAGDVARRAYWIRLNAGTARPWLREGFRHPDLKAWVNENRVDLLTCLFVMVKAWILAGSEKWTGAKLGSFEEWSSTIGGILHFAGVEGFLDNGVDLYDNADQDVSQWDIFLGIWQSLERNDAITAAQLKRRLTDSRNPDINDNLGLQAGLMPYAALADNTRWYYGDIRYNSPEDAVASALRNYRSDFWHNWDTHKEIWTEKDAMVSIILSVANPLGVKVFSTRGYASIASMANTAAPNVCEHLSQGKNVYIYYFGDHDPSGKDIDRSVKIEVGRHLSDSDKENFHFERVAILPEDIEKYDLQTRPTKKTDSRSAKFAGESVELDSMDMRIIKQRVYDCIMGNVPDELMRTAQENEQADKERIAHVLGRIAMRKASRVEFRRRFDLAPIFLFHFLNNNAVSGPAPASTMSSVREVHLQ